MKEISRDYDETCLRITKKNYNLQWWQILFENKSSKIILFMYRIPYQMWLVMWLVGMFVWNRLYLKNTKGKDLWLNKWFYVPYLIKQLSTKCARFH